MFGPFVSNFGQFGPRPTPSRRRSRPSTDVWSSSTAASSGRSPTIQRPTRSSETANPGLRGSGGTRNIYDGPEEPLRCHSLSKEITAFSDSPIHTEVCPPRHERLPQRFVQSDLAYADEALGDNGQITTKLSGSMRR